MEVAAWMNSVQQTAPPKRRATPNASTQARCMRIAQFAARVMKLPGVTIAMLDESGQWRLKCHGLDSRPAIQSTSIFAEAALSDELLVIEDTREDVHFAASPLVTGPSSVRFFAGAPLRSADEVVLGVLCVMGREPRTLSGEERRLLEDTAALLVDCMGPQGEHERAVLETVREAAFEVDAEGQWSFLSPAWSVLTGFPAAESLGRPCREFIHTDERERASSEFRRIVNGEADTCRLKVRLLCAGGGARRVVLRGARYSDDRGRAIGLRGTLADAEEEKEGESERDRMVTALEYERTRLRYVFTHAPAFICILRGPGHTYEMANPAYLHLLGASDVQGRTVAEVVPESARQEWVDLLDYVYEKGEPFAMAEMPMRVPGTSGDAGTRYVNWLCEPLRKANGSVVGVFMHGVDVTEQVLARDGAAEAAPSGHVDADDLPDVVCTVGRDGRFAHANAATVHVWGYDPDELVGRNMTDFVFPDDVPHTLEALAGWVDEHCSGAFENRYLRKDGRVVQMRWSASWSDSDECLYLVAHEVTDRPAVEAASEPEDRDELPVSESHGQAVWDREAPEEPAALDPAACVEPAEGDAPDAAPFVDADLVPPVPSYGTRLRVLLVDGSEESHASLHRLIGATCDLVAVSTYDESVQEAYMAQYDVVLVDFNLSAVWSGLDVLRSLRQLESYRSTTVIACTADVLPGDDDRYRVAGFDGCIARPFRREEVLGALQVQEAGTAEIGNWQ